VYRSKLRGTVGKPDHTAGRREVSASNGAGRSSTRNGVWMVKTDPEGASTARRPVVCRRRAGAPARTEVPPHNPQGNLWGQPERDLQRL